MVSYKKCNDLTLYFYNSGVKLDKIDVKCTLENMGSGSSLQSGKSPTKESNNHSNSVRSQVQDELIEAEKNEKNNQEINEESNNNNELHKNIASGASWRLVNGKKTMVINPSVFKARRLFMNPVNKNKPAEKKLVIKKQVCIFYTIYCLVYLAMPNITHMPGLCPEGGL